VCWFGAEMTQRLSSNCCCGVFFYNRIIHFSDIGELQSISWPLELSLSHYHQTQFCGERTSTRKPNLYWNQVVAVHVQLVDRGMIQSNF
jgi:hypothetical protein